VAVVEPELYRLDEPHPVVPSQSWYAVGPVPADHVKVALEPGSVLPGVGEVSAAVAVAAVRTVGREVLGS
jgi:hypothetical protein